MYVKHIVIQRNRMV